jgi:type IV pilus assembly protein PilV
MSADACGRPAAHRHRGFTVIEVLIAVVVLAIGLLGVAKLSLVASQANGSAYMQGQAVTLAKAIVDNMRANRGQAVTGAYNVTFGTTPAAPQNCATSVCTPAVTATYDLAQWKTLLAANLPSGDGQVVATASVMPNGSTEVTALVSVSWNDSVAQWAFGTAATVTPAAQIVSVETVL